ncbi:hypothetical protein B0O80DRAFT_468787 [Mortierella sp. GBAus27b]|nr:hypothetical protein BGX31_003244 [Mortierella sp. GBA43]KAI8346499.1 hypothetical protein B0O80DRAFT_468787 [Mortierella sp. GBAus27b]
MSGFLTLAKMAFSGPRMALLAGTNTLAARTYATKRVFIASIPWKTSDEEMKEFLAQYGSVVDAYFPKDPMGRTSGYGFVELEESETEAFIREVDGREFKGRPLRAQPANDRDNSERRERGDRGDRGGRGDRGDFRPRRDNYNNRDRREGGDGQYFRRDNNGQSFRRRDDRGYGGDRPYRQDGERGSRGGYSRGSSDSGRDEGRE